MATNKKLKWHERAQVEGIDVRHYRLRYDTVSPSGETIIAGDIVAVLWSTPSTYPDGKKTRQFSGVINGRLFGGDHPIEFPEAIFQYCYGDAVSAKGQAEKYIVKVLRDYVQAANKSLKMFE